MLQLRKTQLQTLSVSRQILQIYPLHRIQFFMIQRFGIYQFLSDVFITAYNAIMNPTNEKCLNLTKSTVFFLHLTFNHWTECSQITAYNVLIILYSLTKHSCLLCSTIHCLYIFAVHINQQRKYGVPHFLSFFCVVIQSIKLLQSPEQTQGRE